MTSLSLEEKWEYEDQLFSHLIALAERNRTIRKLEEEKRADKERLAERESEIRRLKARISEVESENSRLRARLQDLRDVTPDETPDETPEDDGGEP